MELIPILSLIILVATISTFILAVGAYILYKMRERKGKVTPAQPATIPAELVAPAPMMVEQRGAQPVRRTYAEEYQQREPQPEYQRQQAYGGGPSEPYSGPEMRPTYVGSSNYSEAQYQRPTAPTGEYSARKKFLRYTNEGYIEPSQEEYKMREEERRSKNNEESLRWR